MNLSRSATTVDQLRKVSQRTRHITVCCCCCYVQCNSNYSLHKIPNVFKQKFNWKKIGDGTTTMQTVWQKCLLILELLGNLRAKNRNLTKKKIGDALSFSD